MGAKWNMRFFERNFEKEGFDVVRFGYSSRDQIISYHGENLAKELLSLSKKRPGVPIHFVAHSMGGLVLLSALNHPLCPNEAKIGKMALVGSPIKGSAWGRKLHDLPFARWLAKDFSGKELMTRDNFDYLGKFPDTFEDVIVVAGSFGFNPFLKGTNDGEVLLEETEIDIPHKRVVKCCGHKSLIFSKRVYIALRNFFRE